MRRLQKKMDQLKFALYCFKKGQDLRFVKRVKTLGEEYNFVTVESYGDKEGDSAVYLIDMEEASAGFFAIHNRLLALLYFSDQYGMKAVVRYPASYCYAEDHPINGTDNPFEYFFEQPCGISLKDIEDYKLVIRYKKENSYLVNRLCGDANGYARSEADLNEMAQITAKYIRLRQPLKEELQEQIRKLLGEMPALAVHVRGTDFKRNYNGHPVRIGAEEYLLEATRIFEGGHYDRIFLATDDLEAVGLFKDKFGDKLVCYEDVVRSKGNDTVMHSAIERENHHYRLGVEVLRDMYTLAGCEGLVAGLSQVSYAAQIQRKSTGKEYRDLTILDKGINYHGKYNCPV